MKRNLLYSPDLGIYPGEYVPLESEENLRKKFKCLPEEDIILPPVNVKELDDLYKVEVSIPGVKKENFLIIAEGNILSISVLNKEGCLNKGESFQLHEFDYDCFERHIVLPCNTDSEFTKAEYKAGILRFYVPKSKLSAKKSVKKLRTRIVVY
jgi:HSP20 family protein